VRPRCLKVVETATTSVKHLSLRKLCLFGE
jgi:hypothetical protein